MRVFINDFCIYDIRSFAGVWVAAVAAAALAAAAAAVLGVDETFKAANR